MVDCIIVGSGIAGISAALTLKNNGKSFIIFGSERLSDKIRKAEMIANYPGLSNISGEEFCNILQTQLQEAEINITAERVSGVYAMKDSFSVLTQEGNAYESRSVILACGVESVKQIEGETEFVGRGVSYCATCDGFLYKGKTIGVFCTSKALEHEIEYLANFAEKVYLIPMYKDVEISNEKITVIKKMPQAIEGDLKVRKLRFDKAPFEGSDASLPIDGMFMLRECVAPTILVGGLAAENNHVAVDRKMATNLKGCFAAGDCTGRPYQYSKAAGEGNIAAHSVSEYVKNI